MNNVNKTKANSMAAATKIAEKDYNTWCKNNFNINKKKQRNYSGNLLAYSRKLLFTGFVFTTIAQEKLIPLLMYLLSYV